MQQEQAQEDFKPGDRVYVDDPFLGQLRAIMRNELGEEPPPNHVGTVESVRADGTVDIVFDDGGALAPYPSSQTHHLATRPVR